MESHNLHEPPRGDRRASRHPRDLGAQASKRQRTPTPRPSRAYRDELASDPDLPRARVVSPDVDDFSDLYDRRYDAISRERRVRRWFFRGLAVLVMGALVVLLVELMQEAPVRHALYSWATFGLVQ